MTDDRPTLDGSPGESAPSTFGVQGRSRGWIRRLAGHPLAHLGAAILVLALLQGFVIKPFTVPSGSMEHTLEVGDRLLVNRLAGAPQSGDVVVFTADPGLWPNGRIDAADPGVWDALKHAAKWVLGDLLGFGPTTGHTLVKRVIGTAGQTIRCCDAEGRLLVDGVPQDEPYIVDDLPFEPGALDCSTAPRSLRCFSAVTVPEGMLLVLGDHRSASSDGIFLCRGDAEEQTDGGCVRWVRERDVIGEVVLVFWPLGRIGGLAVESGVGAS